MIWFRIKKFAIEHNFLTCIFICLTIFTISAMIIFHEEIFRVKGNTDKKDHYEINELLNNTINNEQIMYFYFNDYLNKCSKSVDVCYDLLGESYKGNYYPNKSDFVKFFNKNYEEFLNPKPLKFALKDDQDSGKNYIYIQTVDEKYYIFEIDGILNYKVYLDYMYY